MDFIVGQGWPRAWWAVKWGEIRLRIYTKLGFIARGASLLTFTRTSTRVRRAVGLSKGERLSKIERFHPTSPELGVAAVSSRLSILFIQAAVPRIALSQRFS